MGKRITMFSTESSSIQERFEQYLFAPDFQGEINMKQLTSYNRVAGYLNKLFDLLNQHFFENELSRPTITIQSTPRAYGHFSIVLHIHAGTVNIT